MIGPVFRLELLQQYRRGRQHTFRWLYAAWLGLEFAFLFLSIDSRRSSSDPSAAGDFINRFVELFAVQQYALVLLVAPAFAAGSVSDEKARNTLQDLLTTDLTSAEIVTGKLLAQVVRILDLALLGLPMLAFVGVIGGMEAELIFAVFLSPLLPLIGVAAASLLASVWCRTTREAVLVLYLGGGIAVAASWTFGGGQRYFDPRYVLEPAWENADWKEWGRRWLEVGRLWGGVALLSFGLAVWRLRPSYARQLIAARSRSGAWGWRPGVGDQPLFWKEHCVERLTGLPGLRGVPRWLALCVVFGLGLLAAGRIVLLSPQWQQEEDFHWLGLGVMLLAGLAAAVRCSGTVSGERERQTWDALLLTPLEAKELLDEKFRGVLAAARPFLIAYALPVLVLSFAVGWSTLCWTISWCLGAWVLMTYMGACGLAASVASTSSWRAMLSATMTSVSGFLPLLVVNYLLGIMVGSVIVLVLFSTVGLIDVFFLGRLETHLDGFIITLFIFRLGPCIAIAFGMFDAAAAKLEDAELHVAQKERIIQRGNQGDTARTALNDA